MAWANFETWFSAVTRFGTSTETSDSSLQQQQSTRVFVQNTIVHQTTINADTRSQYGTPISFGQQTEQTNLCVQNSLETSRTELIDSSQGSYNTYNNTVSSFTTRVRSGFSGPNFNVGGITSTPGQTIGTATTSNTNSSEQLSPGLTYSPYGNSQLSRNIKLGSTKHENVCTQRISAAQKAFLTQTGQHKVSSSPTAEMKPKPIYRNINSGKSQLLDDQKKDDFISRSDTFVPRKSVKKTGENDSSIRSCASSIAEKSSSPLTEPVVMQPMDNTIDLAAVKKMKGSKEPPIKLQDTSILSHSNASENDTMEERPTTLPPSHLAGLVLTRPGYFTVPNLEKLAELVDVNGDCYVEDFTIGRNYYGSIYFPGITNVANLNLDEIVDFKRKKVVVYPDDDNKPPIGEGLNKKAEITLDCVWPRDKSVGTLIKDAEKLKAMKWQDKLEENSCKDGAEFLDYRPETGSWVFKEKHFSKYAG